MFITPEIVLKTIEEHGVIFDAGVSVADVGSGDGKYVFALAQKTKGNGRVYAVDVQKTLLDRISNEAQAQAIENIITVWSDVEVVGTTAIPEYSLDIALLSNILFQVDDQDSVVVEIRRLLKPGGLLVIVEWLDSFGGLGPQPDQVVSPEAVSRLLESHNFHIIDQRQGSNHHYVTLAKKDNEKV